MTVGGTGFFTKINTGDISVKPNFPGTTYTASYYLSRIMQTVLITGANRGIGFEIARQLGRRGWQVLLAGRDAEKIGAAVQALTAEGYAAEPLLLDVADPESIAAAARDARQRGRVLDALVNNAAILLKADTALAANPAEVLERTLRTNVLGARDVVHHFLPLLKNGACIVNLSSGGGSMRDPVGGWSPAYCVSKSALNALTRQLAHELAGRHIAVNAVCPGWVRTGMGGAHAPRSVEKGADTPVWLITEAPRHLSGRFFRDKREIDW